MLASSLRLSKIWIVFSATNSSFCAREPFPITYICLQRSKAALHVTNLYRCWTLCSERGAPPFHHHLAAASFCLSVALCSNSDDGVYWEDVVGGSEWGSLNSARSRSSAKKTCLVCQNTADYDSLTHALLRCQRIIAGDAAFHIAFPLIIDL